MKKIISIIAALSICFTSFADEGMWLLPLIQKMNADAMKTLGCKLTPKQIYDINHSSLKDAIVQFGGGFFRTAPLSLEKWAIILSATSAVLWCGELLRFVLRKKERRA